MSDNLAPPRYTTATRYLGFGVLWSVLEWFGVFESVLECLEWCSVILHVTEAGFSRQLELAFTPERFSEVLEDC